MADGMMRIINAILEKIEDLKRTPPFSIEEKQLMNDLQGRVFFKKI